MIEQPQDIFRTTALDLISRWTCTPDVFYESCTNDTSVYATDEVCDTVAIGMINEDFDLLEEYLYDFLDNDY